MSNALMGGALIGLAAVFLMASMHRVMGASGILGGILWPDTSGRWWRAAFVVGLLIGGVLVHSLLGIEIPRVAQPNLLLSAVAGLVVGFGTRLGNGCTSGHGVCGISRLSPRSMVATVVFIAAGMALVAISRLVGVYP